MSRGAEKANAVMQKVLPRIDKSLPGIMEVAGSDYTGKLQMSITVNMNRGGIGQVEFGIGINNK